MRARRFSLHAVVLASLLAVQVGSAAAQQSGQPPQPASAPPKATEAELRDMALFLARVDRAVRDKNLKAYCDASQASSSYRGYIRNYCLALARNEKRDTATCTDLKVSEMVQKEYADCLATPSPDFAKIAESSQPAKALLLKEAANVGIDGRKILDEAATSLK